MIRPSKEYNEESMDLVVHRTLRSEFDQNCKEDDEVQNSQKGFIRLLVGCLLLFGCICRCIYAPTTQQMDEQTDDLLGIMKQNSRMLASWADMVEDEEQSADVEEPRRIVRKHYAHDPHASPVQKEQTPLEGLNDDKLATEINKIELAQIIHADYKGHKHGYHRNIVQEFANFFHRHASKDGLQFINDQLYLIHQLIKRMLDDTEYSDENFKSSVTKLLRHWFNLQREQHNNLYVVAAMTEQIDDLQPHPISKLCRGARMTQMMANFFLDDIVNNEFGIDNMPDNASAMSGRIIQIHEHFLELGIAQETSNAIVRRLLHKLAHKIKTTHPNISRGFSAFIAAVNIQIFGHDKRNYFYVYGGKVKRGKGRPVKISRRGVSQSYQGA